ncbi:MAG: hypothetical protein V8R40_00205 [Dysosmobacter sp.]
MLIAVLFLVGLCPIALVVLLVKLFGRDGKKRTQAPPLQTDRRGSPPPLSPGGHSRRPEKSPSPRR